jgi:hypothetical protein
VAAAPDEARRTDKLLELSRKLAETGDLPSILSLVIDALRDLLDADRATVFEYDAKTDELFTQVAHGIGGAGDAPKVIRIPRAAGIAGAAATSRQIVNIPDAYEDARFNRAVDQRTGYRTRTILSIPLLDHDGQLVFSEAPVGFPALLGLLLQDHQDARGENREEPVIPNNRCTFPGGGGLLEPLARRHTQEVPQIVPRGTRGRVPDVPDRRVLAERAACAQRLQRACAGELCCKLLLLNG